MKYFNYKTTVFSVIFALAVFPVLAESNLEDRVQKAEEKQDRIQERNEAMLQRKEEFKENKCQNLGERIKLKVMRYDQNRERHVERYRNLKERVSNWAERAETEGLDVTTLKANLATINTKIDNLQKLHEGFITDLEDLQDYDCGNSDGAYAQGLVTSRQSLQEIREAVLDIRKYYLENIKPEIQKLRAQMVQAETSETE